MCRALRPVPVSRGPAALTAARRTDAGTLRQQKALRLQGFPFYCFRFAQGAGVPVGTLASAVMYSAKAYAFLPVRATSI